MPDSRISKVVNNRGQYKVTIPKCIVKAMDLDKGSVRFKIINNNIVMRKIK